LRHAVVNCCLGINHMVTFGRAPEDALVVLLPTYNDWDALELLLGDLNRALRSVALAVHVLVVDDASVEPVSSQFLKNSPCEFSTVSVLRLRANLGHQRAIAIGLAYVAANLPCRGVVVMDSDGEDRPAGVVRLLEACEQQGWRRIIFASRAKRLEGVTFRVCYRLYRYTHRLLTGVSVRVGNFSIIPARYLNYLTTLSDLWNHYAAAVFRSKIPYTDIPIGRGLRLAGKSKMNFLALLVHGLSAISVYADLIAVRISALAILLVGLFVLCVGGAFAAKPAGPWFFSFVILFAVVLQAAILSSLAAVIVLTSRNRPTFLPYRDCPLFIDGVTAIAVYANHLVPGS